MTTATQQDGDRDRSRNDDPSQSAQSPPVGVVRYSRYSSAQLELGRGLRAGPGVRGGCKQCKPPTSRASLPRRTRSRRNSPGE